MIFEKLRIRRLAVQPARLLAPMAGITDTVFRRLIKQLGGCGLVVTELVSCEGLVRRERRSEAYLRYTEQERPIAAQLFGAHPEHLAEAARRVEALGFDLLDLNLGCPAKKVIRCGGSGLLRDLALLKTILNKIRAAISIPFTVKMRAGWSEDEIVAAEVARLAEACGVDAVIVHPRTRLEGFSGRARWEVIRDVKQAVQIPVIGNGDVFTPQDALALYQQTSCDGVMIGRAALKNPWIFRQTDDFFRTGSYQEPVEADRYRMLRDYCEMLFGEDPRRALAKMKQFVGWFTHGVRNGTELRRQVQSAGDTGQALQRIEAFFALTPAATGAREQAGAAWAGCGSL